VWPPEVERVAAFLRAAGIEGRLEEVASDDSNVPGPAVRAEAYECDRRTIVALIPEDREVDEAKLAAAGRCPGARRVDAPRFPYSNAVVLIDRLVLGEQTVWIEAGTECHVVGLAPAQLVELTSAQSADLVADARNGGG
jgi:prolyl-tRNA editing enzyme YbaK/EbsC (Cys-tRNA(Pro) deacylase)